MDKNRTIIKKGLTLVELLVVILIIAALAAVAVPTFSKFSGKANEHACESNCDIISTQIEQYKVTTDEYPANITDVTEDTNYFPDGPPVCPKEGAYYMDENYRAACTHTLEGSGC